jgi:hypothetical protein
MADLAAATEHQDRHGALDGLTGARRAPDAAPYPIAG